jgi:hypothetical protein
LFLDTVNPITFGHVGVSTLIASLSMMRYCTRRIEWVSIVAATSLGIALILIAGSRGPLLSLLICVVAAAVLAKHKRWLLLLMISGGLLMLSESFSDTQTVLTSRIKMSEQLGSFEERVHLTLGAFEQFLDSPLIGSAIVVNQLEASPHNPFLEAAMAVGIGALLLLIAIYIKALIRIFRSLRQGELLLPLLALQALVAAQVSGSLAASATMWMFLALFSSAPQQKHPFVTTNSQPTPL